MRIQARACALAAVLALAASTLPGCLIGEFEEETITLSGDGQSGNYTLVMRNIQSDAREAEGQQKDFDTLLGLWRGDRHLLDRVQSGLYVKHRHISLDGGVLVGRETGLFCDLANVDLHLARDGTVRRGVPRGMTVVSTNGKVVQLGDSVCVAWPEKTREFRMVSRVDSFRPAGDLVGRFRALSP
jgi:hypothetical protein